MTEARAFPFLRYNPDVVGDPGELLAPPYDVISPDERARLASRAPHQSVLLELPAGGDPAVARRLLDAWRQEQAVEDGGVGIAVIQQRYTGPDGVRRTRVGVACEVGVHPFAEGKVLPHERTFDAPMRQRLQLMEVAGANISPVFLVYHDDERALADLVSSVTDEEPDFTAADAEGTQTAVWFCTDVAVCDQFEQAVAPHPLLVADGHHRYTAAVAYREQVGHQAPQLSVVGGTEHTGPPHSSTAGAAGVLAVVCNSADAGMEIFPTHRVLQGVDLRQLDEFVLGSGAFEVAEHPDLDAAMAQLASLEVPGFVVHTQVRSSTYALADPVDLELAAPEAGPAARSLDVVALHALVLDGGAVLGDAATDVTYTRSLDEARSLVDGAADRAAFLLRGADVRVVHEVARSGEVLPQKSTYFFPKVPTGVVFREL